MNNYYCFLITILYNDTLLRCALKVNRDELSGDIVSYPMEPENREKLRELLPLHVRSCGKIVEVDTSLFDIHVIE